MSTAPLFVETTIRSVVLATPFRCRRPRDIFPIVVFHQ